MEPTLSGPRSGLLSDRRTALSAYLSERQRPAHARDHRRPPLGDSIHLGRIDRRGLVEHRSRAAGQRIAAHGVVVGVHVDGQAAAEEGFAWP